MKKVKKFPTFFLTRKKLLLIYFEKHIYWLQQNVPNHNNGKIKFSKFYKNFKNSLTLEKKSDLTFGNSFYSVLDRKSISPSYTRRNIPIYSKEILVCWTVLTPAVDSHEAPVVKPFLGVIVMARWQHLILCPGWWHQKNADVTTAPVNETDGEYHVFEFVYLGNSSRARFGGYGQLERASWWDVSVQQRTKPHMRRHKWYYSVSLYEEPKIRCTSP